ncbi:MAG: M13 family metallopeptidase N-terminal domain-containing protein, partial [Gammaproteobacteria bacterium]
MDTSIRPQDDFYRYANGGWLARTEIPPERSSYGAFTEVHERNEKRLKTILEEAATADAPAGSDMQLVGTFYASYMDRARADALGLKPLDPLLAEIAEASTHEDILRLYGQ